MDPSIVALLCARAGDSNGGGDEFRSTRAGIWNPSEKAWRERPLSLLGGDGAHALGQDQAVRFALAHLLGRFPIRLVCIRESPDRMSMLGKMK